MAPSPMGTMMVATPAPKARVPATTRPRERKPVAKYAGSITEMQHGASSATIPPRNDASSVVPNNSSPIRRPFPAGHRPRRPRKPMQLRT